MNEPKPWQQLIQMITGYWISRAIYVAAKLRIADHLKDGPRSAEELAAAGGVAPRPVARPHRRGRPWEPTAAGKHQMPCRTVRPQLAACVGCKEPPPASLFSAPR